MVLSFFHKADRVIEQGKMRHLIDSNGNWINTVFDRAIQVLESEEDYGKVFDDFMKNGFKG